jgi:hypothetical protein
LILCRQIVKNDGDLDGRRGVETEVIEAFKPIAIRVAVRVEHKINSSQKSRLPSAVWPDKRGVSSRLPTHRPFPAAVMGNVNLGDLHRRSQADKVACCQRQARSAHLAALGEAAAEIGVSGYVARCVLDQFALTVARSRRTPSLRLSGRGRAFPGGPATRAGLGMAEAETSAASP